MGDSPGPMRYIARSPKLIMVEDGERMSSVADSPPTRPEDTPGGGSIFWPYMYAWSWQLCTRSR